MKYTSVEDALKPLNAAPPQLNALRDDGSLSRVTILQPQGSLAANERGIRNTNQKLASEKIRAFIATSRDQNADLVITPEYSTPWEIAEDINSGLCPADGQVWIICFESITPAELRTFKDAYQNIEMVFSIPEGRAGNFLNPLAYVFKVQDAGQSRTVILLQFKTKPMVDTELQLERTSLIYGDDVYIFGDVHGPRLASIICSDALDFNPNDIDRPNPPKPGPWASNPFILIHPQLNRSPTHRSFRAYRDLWAQKSVDHKQIICANWARHTEINGRRGNQNEFGRSAIYLREPFNSNLDDLRNAHDKGLYYTATPDRTHGLYFNFEEAIFDFQIVKVGRAGINPASANRPFPRIARLLNWEVDRWKERAAADDEYISTCKWRSTDPVYSVLRDTKHLHQLEKELIINRATGHSFSGAQNFQTLNSVRVNAEEEILRFTFAQDKSDRATEFRARNIEDFVELCLRILTNPQTLPDNIKGYTDPQLGIFEFGQNLRSSNGSKAVVCNIGPADSAKARQTYSSVLAALNPTLSRKICVFHRIDGAIQFYVNLDASIDFEAENPAYIAKGSKSGTAII